MSSASGTGQEVALSKFVCSNCRTRKIKCHRQLPSCSFCQDNGLVCSYNQAQKKRGLRAGYVASLEDRLEKVEEEVRLMKGMFQMQNKYPLTAGTPSAQAHVRNSPPGPILIPPDYNNRSIEDIIGLPSHAIDELCNLWFTSYHPWFPILHKLSFLEYLKNRETQPDSTSNIVLRAILAVTLSHGVSLEIMSNERRLEIVTALQAEVILHTSTNLSLQTLQAALIITNIYYGDGNLHKFWNAIAVCKRIGTQLGLHDLVTNHGENYNKLSTVPPRMLALPRTVIEQEERIRSFWMAEVLDNLSTLGTGWNLSVLSLENHALLPCNEIVWAFPERAVDALSPLNLDSSSLFSLYVSLVAGELFKVHAFLRQKFDHCSTANWKRQRDRCTMLDANLSEWRQSKEVVEALSSHSPTSDSLFVLINATLNTAVIIIYQRSAFPVPNTIPTQEPWYHAIQRCLDECNNLAESIRRLSEDSLEKSSPHFVFCIFNAARFLIVRSRTLEVNVPRCFDLLMYGLNTCAQRWYFASRLEKVLRHSRMEINLPLSESALPLQFYDLQYSSVDIDEALRIWATDH